MTLNETGGNAPVGWTKSGDMQYIKTYTNNTTNDPVTFVDVAGNPVATGIVVNKIDRVVPVCGTWSYDPNTPTSGDVIAILSGSTDTGAIAIAGGNCDITTVGGSCEVTISDQAGNTTVCESDAITHIDRTNPEIQDVIYDPDVRTNGDVTVTVILTETGGNAPVGWTKSGANSYVKIYTGTMIDGLWTGTLIDTVTFYDEAGNEVDQDILPLIDKIVPVVLFSGMGNPNPEQRYSTIVTVTDEGGSLVNTGELRYLWSTGVAVPTSGAFITDAFTGDFDNGSGVRSPDFI